MSTVEGLMEAFDNSQQEEFFKVTSVFSYPHRLPTLLNKDRRIPVKCGHDVKAMISSDRYLCAKPC
jgi:hypothetical protein